MKDTLFKNYPGHDRFQLPDPLVRVTAGLGGEAILILGSEKTGIYDCGMACFHEKLIENIQAFLEPAGRTLDYVFMSHTHYDHIGALPYLIRQWPEVKVCGSQKAEKVFLSEGAKKTMVRLGENARNLYGCGDVEITAEGLRLDIAMAEGDAVSLGDISMVAYETKGHTDCCVSYMIEPLKILFTSESTGVHVGPDFLYTAILKSYKESIESAEKLAKLDVNYIVSPHYGVIPQHQNDVFFKRCIQAADEEKALVDDGVARGLSLEEILDNHKARYWTEERDANQPYAAYRLNAEITCKLLMAGK